MFYGSPRSGVLTFSSPCWLPPPNRNEALVRYVVMVDGEHYPPVVESAIAELRQRGHQVLGAVMLGGREKLPAGGIEAYGDVSVKVGADPRDSLHEEIARLRPDAVLDLSDEPVLDYRRRLSLIHI